MFADKPLILRVSRGFWPNLKSIRWNVWKDQYIFTRFSFSATENHFWNDYSALKTAINFRKDKKTYSYSFQRVLGPEVVCAHCSDPKYNKTCFQNVFFLGDRWIGWLFKDKLRLWNLTISLRTLRWLCLFWNGMFRYANGALFNAPFCEFIINPQMQGVFVD